MIKHTAQIAKTFLDFVSCSPTFSPMGIIAISAPRVKRLIPSTRKIEPTAKSASTEPDRGAMVKCSARTMTRIGSTDNKASFTFSSSFLPISSQNLYRILIYTIIGEKRKLVN